MLIPLIITLGIMALISYVLTSGKIYSVGFLTNIVFLVSSLLLLLREAKWNVSISFETYQVIVLGNIMVMIGEFIVLAINQKRIRQRVLNSQERAKHGYIISKRACIIVSCIMILATAFYFYAVYQTIRLSSYNTTYALMAYRIASGQGRGLYSTILTIINIFSSVFAYIFSGVLISRIINKEKIYFRLFTPIICHVAIQILSSSRYGLLTFAGGIMIMFSLMLIESSGKKNRMNFKAVRTAIIIVSAAIAVFWVAGSLTGKTNTDTDFVDTVVIYGGSPIFALNRWLAENHVLGTLEQSEALLGLFNLFNRLGITVFNAGSKIRNAIIVYRSSSELLTTNIYTCYRAYLHDFSYLGTMLVRLGFGVFYAYLFHVYPQGKKKRNPFKCIVIVSLLTYPVFMQITEESFLNELFTITTVLSLFVINIVFNRIVIEENNAKQ